MPVEAGKDYVFCVSDVNSLTADADCELFFDFGGTPAGANVKIHDIIFEEAE